MAELLLELFSEEIPARLQARGAEDLCRLVTERLTAIGLVFAQAKSFSTPRRLALSVTGLPLRQPDQTEERKGPRVGAPQPAIDGFLRSTGLTELSQCTQRTVGKAVFWFAETRRPGRDTRDVLSDLVGQAILAMPWAKSMRWGRSGLRWVRPLHGILAIFDGQPLDGGLFLGQSPEMASPRPMSDADIPSCPAGSVLAFSNITRGHRFLAPDPFPVDGLARYCDGLRARYVILDRAERRQRILDQATALVGREGLALVPDEALADEVAGLVEWPTALIGSIDQAFMAVPQEVLITSMRTHQKYFAVRRLDGALACRFVVIANLPLMDGDATIVSGNERVLRARLSDAKFFWDQDLKTPLRARLGALKAIVFHARLGTMFDRTTRLEALTGALADALPGVDAKLARHAAILSKTDLVTDMVGEFPELQGVMGRYYALAGGDDPGVADALAEQYKPLGPSDKCPTSPLSVTLALADKIDMLVGFFAIGERPTGSKDPFALRRAALGVIRITLENGLRLRLGDTFRAVHSLYPQTDLHSAATVTDQLLAFFAERLKGVLRDRGVRHDLIDAVFGLGDEDDLVRLVARVMALQTFLVSEDGANLLIAYRRAANIVRIEEKKDGVTHGAAPDPALFAVEEEIVLFRRLTEVSAASADHFKHEAFSACMGDLATLRGPVDALFERVTVNTEDAAVRRNRLRLLSQIRATLNAVADFGRIEG